MVSHDPDIQHLPLFAVTTSLLGATSSYYNKVMTFDWISNFFVRNQHFWFIPVMAIARINLYVQSLVHILVNMRGVWRVLEFSAMMVYFSWLTCLIAALPTYQERVVFFLLSHGITGLLHLQICVSHFSMETIDLPFSSAGENWVEHQSRTTLDIAHNQYTKWIHGGLDMQLEHHLFPRMARHSLYKAEPRIRSVLKAHGIVFKELSFFDSIVAVLNRLHQVSVAVRAGDSDVHGVLSDFMNARG